MKTGTIVPLASLLLVAACEMPTVARSLVPRPVAYATALEPGTTLRVMYNTIEGGIIDSNHEAIVTGPSSERYWPVCTDQAGFVTRYISSVNFVGASQIQENGAKGQALLSGDPIPLGTRLRLRQLFQCSVFDIFEATVISGADR